MSFSSHSRETKFWIKKAAQDSVTVGWACPLGVIVSLLHGTAHDGSVYLFMTTSMTYIVLKDYFLWLIVKAGK